MNHQVATQRLRSLHEGRHLAADMSTPGCPDARLSVLLLLLTPLPQGSDVLQTVFSGGLCSPYVPSLPCVNLQVGYGAFPLSIVEYLWRAKQPYNVSAASEIAACAALTNMQYLKVSQNLELTCHHAAKTLLQVQAIMI